LNERARYVEIAGAPHAAHHKSPDTVGQVMRDFLAQVDLEKAGNHGAVS
jgi:pimeloyl-ACP methyl ester carboxylesterase